MNKKVILIALFLCLIVLINISANQENLPDEDEKVEKESIKQIIKEKPNEILSKEIELPGNIENIAKIIFGLESEDKLNLQFLIILSCVFIFILLILFNAVQFIPSFEKSTAWIGTLVIALIISVSGGIRYFSLLLFDLGNIFNILEKWSALKLGFIVISIFILYYILSIIIGLIKETVLLGRAVSDGLKAGAQIAKLKAMAEIEENLNHT